MSFYKNTNRTKDGRKIKNSTVILEKDDDSFYKKTDRDGQGRKKKKH